jgi:hypothetical protein
MRKRLLIGGSSLLLALFAMSGTRADACDHGCGCGGCGYPVYRLPLYFSHPLQTSFVYYPYGRRWSHGRRMHHHHHHHHHHHRRHMGHRH